MIVITHDKCIFFKNNEFRNSLARKKDIFFQLKVRGQDIMVIMFFLFYSQFNLFSLFFDKKK